ncbi:MAG TPA: hypothetical protein VK843_08355 [Planctomycetota bacterium]|nr:hypothetical protein [Planctomycetota bacterium]
MSDGAAIELERVLADALTSADPAQFVQRAAQDPRNAAATRAALQSIDLDGLRISALIVVKLRFERLLQGSQNAADWFETDPRGFAAAFKRYHLEIAQRAATPVEEAAKFEVWHAAHPAQ